MRSCGSTSLELYIPAGDILCDDVNCANEDHKKHLSIYCEDLIQMCVKAGDECFPKARKKKSQIPYWNEIVQHRKKVHYSGMVYGHNVESQGMELFLR